MAIPVCWTVWGSRRDSWIVDADPENELDRRRRREVIRDIFAYQITEDTWVFTNVWFEGHDYHEQRSVQQVDYPHGLHLQHRTSLHMDQEMYDCELQDVVSVRAALHFVHLWKRNARMKLLRRLLYDVLLTGRRRQMPPAIIQQIYAFVRPVATALSGSSASSKESEDCILEDVTYEVFVGYCRAPNSDVHPHRPYLHITGEPFARCNFCLKFLEHTPNSDN